MGLTARDIMNPEVVAVPQDMDLRDLAKLFLKEGFTGAPVVDAAGELVGVISQTDLVYYNLTRGDQLVDESQFYHQARVEGAHLPRGFQIADFNTGRVADIMTPVVHSVTERAGLETIAKLMTRNHIHRVIVRRGRKAVGILSALDVLRAFAREARREPAAARR
jgi:predicted transcriptional regulator